MSETPKNWRVKAMRPYSVAKRGFDVAASVAALVILAPALVGIGIAVAVTSPGGVLFRHRRVGRYGRPFFVLKFRTMRREPGGLPVTSSSDPRITPLGRVLRHYKLDELPQLVNVLLGDMSIVGPRPEVEKYVSLNRADYDLILTLRPGLTDFAAIEFRDEEAVLAEASDPEAAYLTVVLPRKIALYKRYIEECSLTVDAKIIVDTFRALLH